MAERAGPIGWPKMPLSFEAKQITKEDMSEIVKGLNDALGGGMRLNMRARQYGLDAPSMPELAEGINRVWREVEGAEGHIENVQIGHFDFEHPRPCWAMIHASMPVEEGDDA